MEGKHEQQDTSVPSGGKCENPCEEFFHVARSRKEA